VSLGVIYHSNRAVPGTADVVHKLKKLVCFVLLMRTVIFCSYLNLCKLLLYECISSVIGVLE